MKTKIFTLIMLICICGLSSQAVVWPTKVVNVDPDPGTSIGALQNAITANGSAIYVLKRGGTYLTNGQYAIPSAAGTLIIRAEAGTGPRPIIMGGVPTSGYPAGDNVIRVSSDIKFENIYFTGEDMNGVVHKNTIRVNSGSWFEFNGCMFDKDNAASIRNESQNCTYTFYNCTFRNQVDYTSLNNGRGFDARDAKQHLTLIMKNCTFYDMSKQIIRPSTSDFDSIIFVNNTCYNIQVGLYFGRAKKAVCNNNIFYNMGLSGNEDQTSGILVVDSINTATDATRTFDFRNNLFYTDQQYLDIMKAPADTFRYLLPLLNPVAKSFLKKGQMIISDTIKNLSLAFTNPPPLILGYVQYMWQNDWTTSFTPTASQRLEAMEDPLNFGDVLPPKVPFSFAYPTTSPAYTGGLKGDILGDKKWFGSLVSAEAVPMQKDNDIYASFEKGTGTLRLDFKKADLISFRIQLYGLDGRLVTNRLIFNYGQKTAKIETQGLSRGMYVYNIETAGSDGQRKYSQGKVVY